MTSFLGIFIAVLSAQLAATVGDTSDAATAQPIPSNSSNVIDRHIFARLDDEGITPSDISTDAEFLRRVTITTTGQLPTPGDVRQFLIDTASDKRTRKIEELLTDKLH